MIIGINLHDNDSNEFYMACNTIFFCVKEDLRNSFKCRQISFESNTFISFKITTHTNRVRNSGIVSEKLSRLYQYIQRR